MEQAWAWAPTIKWQPKEFLLSFIQSTEKCYDVLWHLVES